MIPVPINPDEILSVKEAAHLAQQPERTIRRWARQYGIGRQPERHSPLQVSVLALEMRLCGDDAALDLLRSNCRDDPAVRYYSDRLGLT
ncbi:hypothetical protein D3C80_1655590 [compost metagenome]